jgi:uncharacterized protein (TIGR00369 family)
VQDHYRALERMYLHAPTNARYHDLAITIGEGVAVVGFTVEPTLHHAAGAMHGAHYFKLLDDAAYFAASAMVPDVLMLTAQMSIQLLRPIVAGRIEARGRVTRPGRTTFFAHAELVGPDDKVLATGHSAFNRSTMPFSEDMNYRLG